MPWAGPCWVCEAAAGCLQAQTFFTPIKMVSCIGLWQEENVTVFSSRGAKAIQETSYKELKWGKGGRGFSLQYFEEG